jgi:WD40 repeat protein
LLLDTFDAYGYYLQGWLKIQLKEDDKTTIKFPSKVKNIVKSLFLMVLRKNDLKTRSLQSLTLFIGITVVFCLLIYLIAVSLQNSAQLDRSGIKVNATDFSPDRKTVASGIADGRIILWDMATGREQHTLRVNLGGSVTNLAFSPNGKTLASVGKDSVIRLWDVANSKPAQILQAHENFIHAIAFSPNGKILASGGEDTRLTLWDVATAKPRQILESGHTDGVNAIAFSPDGKTLASAGKDSQIVLWDATTGAPIQTLPGHGAGVLWLTFSPDGKTLASASEDRMIRLWDSKTDQLKLVLQGHTQPARMVAFSPSGNLVSSSADGLRLWNTETGKQLHRFRAEKTSTGLSFSPNGKVLLSASSNGQLSLFDLTSGQTKPDIQVPIKQSTLLSNLSFDARMKTAAGQVIDNGPGGPILVVTSSANAFSAYYAEILRNEGLNLFSNRDIASVSPASLAAYDLIILGEMRLTPEQVKMFSNWVKEGGRLIAMRPDQQLASLLGLSDAAGILPNGGYLQVDGSTPAGAGIVSQTMQFHGAADRYTLNGATSLATLYTDAATATANPAVTLHQVGKGQASAFTYDLARSVVYTRQGNPDWATQERDGLAPIRSNDLFFGPANHDHQSDWVDLEKVAIPQADEQQRLLANLMIIMNLAQSPLPRFWYFPRGAKAVVLMTGDDHANGGTVGRFEQFKQQSPANCSVKNWECIRGTSYIYPGTPMTNQQAAAYDREGFEIDLHINTNCENFTPGLLVFFYTDQLRQFSGKYPSLPASSTQRHHCLVWSDWSTTPEVELSHGIRLDTTYYYWPPSWILNRPGLFTGSGMPMRFAKLDGTMIDVYQATTQMTDESGQAYPYHIDTLLDRALGAEGYYGVFTVNAHTDVADSSVADAVVKSAQTRGVPIVSARQMLTWLDSRNNSAFEGLTWNGRTLQFKIAPSQQAIGLQAMIPARSINGRINNITYKGQPVTYTKQVIKGIEYACFAAGSGFYTATYTAGVK